jgi:hypothetical protein
MGLARFIFLVSMVGALAACSGPQILAGDNYTVSITAGPLDDVSGLAARYCQKYSKRAVPIGNKPLGPSTTRRLYVYDCASPIEPHS